MSSETIISAPSASPPARCGVIEIRCSGVCDGTRVAVPGGHRRIETLSPGDHVLTRNHGSQQILGVVRDTAWTGVQPVRIAAGALGNRVSCSLAPGTRVLVSSWKVELHFALEECLVPVSTLVGASGIVAADVSVGGWAALVLPRPGLISMNDILVESLGAERDADPSSAPPVMEGSEARLLLPG